MSLPGTAAIPAVHAARLVAAEETGRAAVRLAADGLTPDRSSRRRRSRTRCACCSRSAARPTRSSISPRSPDGSAFRCRPRAPESRSPTRRRCSSISSRSATATWRTSTPPAASARCCASWRRCSIPTASASTATTLGARLAEPAPWVDRRVIRPLRRSGLAGRRPGRARGQPRAATAPSSSAPRRRRRCSRSKAAPWSSRTSRTWPLASTIPNLDVVAERRPRAEERRAPRGRACPRPAICRSRASWRAPA